jgi:hypothetical protein
MYGQAAGNGVSVGGEPRRKRDELIGRLEFLQFLIEWR